MEKQKKTRPEDDKRYHDTLADMSTDMIEHCAMRILYHGKRIAVEIFHSLTDDYGGLMFFNFLITEYLAQKRMISPQTVASIQQANTGDIEFTVDDYISCAGTKTTSLNHLKVYKLPGKTSSEEKITITTQI